MKKNLFAILAAALLATAAMAQANPCDVNFDTKVNTADVVAVYSFIENGAESGFIRADCDVNRDGKANTADVVAIYSIIINGSVE